MKSRPDTNQNSVVQFTIPEKSFPLFQDLEGKYLSIEGDKIIEIKSKEISVSQLKKGKYEKIGAEKFKKEIGTCEFAKYYGNGSILIPEGTNILSLWDVNKKPTVVQKVQLANWWKNAPAYFDKAFYYFGEFGNEEGLLEINTKNNQPRLIHQDDLMSAKDGNVYGDRLIFATTYNIIGFKAEPKKGIIREFKINANLSEPRIEFLGKSPLLLVFDKAMFWKAAVLYFTLEGKPKKLGELKPKEAARLWKIQDDDLWLVSSFDKKEILNFSHYKWTGKEFKLQVEYQLSTDGNEFHDITFHTIVPGKKHIEIFGGLEGNKIIVWKLDI